MNPIWQLAIGSLGGGLGAWLRMVIRDECVVHGIPSWRAIVIINLLGCAVAGAVASRIEDPQLALFVTAGVLGGFTTFSSMCVDVVVQWTAKRRLSALGALSTGIAAPLCAWLGGVVFAAATAHPTAAHGSAAGAAPSAFPLGRNRISHHLSGLVLIAMGAAVGTAARIGLGIASMDWGWHGWFATALANVVGAGFAGFVFRWIGAIGVDGSPVDSPSRQLLVERLLISGLAGGLTTFSTVALEIHAAFYESPWRAVIIAVANLAVGIPATMGGWALAAALRRPRRYG